jgi:glyoxylase-like metal-dependent hydrolase (beta-lactamase superfamily II)
MANKNEIVRLTDGIYQIKYYWLGIANVYAYLIIGEERALLIDTCYSITGISNYVRQVTSLPVDVVNTHGHFDHIGGNAEFENIYLSGRDLDTAKEHSDYQCLKEMMDNYERKNLPVRLLLKFKRFREPMERSLHIAPVNYKELPECGYFELGNRKVMFIETPGHTPGSICLFDEKTGFFFVGDMACEEGVLLGFDYSASVEEYERSIRKMQKFYKENKGKSIIPSHHKMPAGEDVFERYISICEDILAGKLTGSFEDQGLCKGYVVKRDGLQMIYRNAR